MPLVESTRQVSATAVPHKKSARIANPPKTQPQDQPQNRPLAQQTPTREPNLAADNDQVCWIEVKRYPYQPDHQVELLHLQAEADALLMKLQNAVNQA